MAVDLKRFDVGSEKNVFVGERKFLRIAVVDEDGNPYNMTGKSLRWQLRRGADGPVILAKTSGAAEITLGNGTGTHDVAIVEIAPEDTVDQDDETILIDPGTFAHALKQEDDEAVLSYGAFVFRVAAAR